jgi:hypothetical protein
MAGMVEVLPGFRQGGDEEAVTVSEQVLTCAVLFVQASAMATEFEPSPEPSTPNRHLDSLDTTSSSNQTRYGGKRLTAVSRLSAGLAGAPGGSPSAAARRREASSRRPALWNHGTAS